MLVDEQLPTEGGHLEGPGLAVGMRGTARIAPPGKTLAEHTHRLHHVALRWNNDERTWSQD